jgi:YfiH family protein
MDNTYITFDIFKAFTELVCAFSTRRGGFSTGNFAQQNLGNFECDAAQLIQLNRQQFYNRLNIQEENIVLPKQIHSGNCTIFTSSNGVPRTDALLTSTPGLFLGVVTADCFPVFLYSPQKNVVGIVHAGWRGVVQNIISHTVQKMNDDLDVAAPQVYAAIGPGLQQDCFEVRQDVYLHFPDKYLNNHADNTKRWLNLSLFIRDQLLKCGIPIDQIEVTSMCTKCSDQLYYSYRRDGINTGRMMGIIGIQN